MKWSNIFTIPDSSIVQEGSVDPLGMQIIWTHFGQKIFNNKLTTVATDIRNYSVNLLQLYVLYCLENDRSDVFHHAKNKFTDYTNDYDLKAGLLILMEDAMVFSLMMNRNNEELVDTLGLLGSYNAEKQLIKEPAEILIEAEKSKGVLVRQLQLGVTGRYKGPFINMGLLTKTLKYNGDWEEVKTIIDQWPEGKELADTLVALICELIEVKSGSHILLSLAELQQKQDTIDQYVRCFGKLNMNLKLRKYWEKHLGLEQGAAQALYEQVGVFDNKTHPGIIIQKAQENQTGEAQYQLEQIIRLEPFLSNISQVFYLLTDIGNKKLSTLKEQLIQLVERIDLSDIVDLQNENPRLKMLAKYVQDANGDALKFAEKIVEYHSAIMQNRGGGAWVEVQEDNIKHYIAQRTPIKTEDFIKSNYWYHDYYLGSIRSIYNGLNPN